MLTSGQITLCVDARILLEYEDVLRRPKFDINPQRARMVLEYVHNSSQVHGAAPLPKTLPDADDNPFLEVACCAAVESLVTGNLQHFPGDCLCGMRVLSPGRFLEFFKERRA